MILRSRLTITPKSHITATANPKSIVGKLSCIPSSCGESDLASVMDCCACTPAAASTGRLSGVSAASIPVTFSGCRAVSSVRASEIPVCIENGNTSLAATRSQI